ncbi:MAG: bifunctional demethylmenaquinone methyltransferase/2-methoxy-6-polyprenyl-1,4-benzoquinol methylase UbiE [Bryobacteraceae bacterium]
MTGGARASGDEVREMFGRIAPRYDRLNHVLSFNIDRYWRARTADLLESILRRPGARVLDLCCGSGDLLLALEARGGAGLLGGDFCHPMLVEAARKLAREHSRSSLFEADALSLPLADRSLDLVTLGFGFRNLTDYRAGLAEIRRVLKAGGTAAILEFSTPPNAAFRAFYRFYSRRLLPRIGAVLSGSREAYEYLPDSVERFPDAATLAGEMQRAGFTGVRFYRMTLGVVALHLGRAS